MSKRVNVTGAESCWDDGFEDDGSCEKYLQQKKAELIAEDEITEDDYEEEPDEETASADEDEDEDEEIHDTAENDDGDETADEPVVAKVAKSKSSVPAKPPAGKITKADAIRAIITAKQKAGIEIRPRDIKAELEGQGIDVNASQISITLRAMGVPPAKNGPGRPAGSKNKAATAEPRSRATARFAAVAEDAEHEVALNYAADLLKAAGSYEAAVSALATCRKLAERS